MNVAFFLTPKIDVVWIPAWSTIRQAMERMAAHRYTAVPLLDAEGHYVATLTEGDLLWTIRETPDVPLRDIERQPLTGVQHRIINRPVAVDAEMEALLSLAIDQNFVPVVDSREVFIGIVRRKVIIEYCAGVLSRRPGGSRRPGSNV